MINKKCKSKEHRIKKLQNIKGGTQLKFKRTTFKLYDEMNYPRQSQCFDFEEDRFSKTAQGQAMIMLQAWLIMKLFQTNSETKKNIFDDFHSTVFLNFSATGEK